MPYKDGGALPDPAFVLTMGNVIAHDSNFYAVQKTFDGAFSFDVVYDSQSAGTNINGTLNVLPTWGPPLNFHRQLKR